jgi:hypothetical protein
VEARAKQPGHGFSAFGDLGVAARVANLLGQLGELAEQAAFGGCEIGLALFDDMGRLHVLGIFAGFKDVRRKGGVIGFRGPGGGSATLQSVLDGRHGRGGTRHDAAEQGECGPVADALPHLGEAFAAAHEVAAEAVDGVEEFGVRARQCVGDFGFHAAGKGRILAHPGGHVGAAALDEVARQVLPLRFGEPGDLPTLELGAKQTQQRGERGLDAAVGRGR